MGRTYFRPVVMHYFWLNAPVRAELADFFACLKTKKKNNDHSNEKHSPLHTYGTDGTEEDVHYRLELHK